MQKPGILGVLFLVFSVQVAAVEEPIGSIKTYRPEAVISRGGMERPAEIGGKVYSGDTIVTHSEGAVGVMFLDGSVLSLGPETEFVIEDFLFEPDTANVSFLTRILRGTVSFLSGAIGRIAPQSVRFNTPTATLGLRGTKVLIKVD
ncbi:MAG: FecR family protein [Gammaproteobacteria bacterium]